MAADPIITPYLWARRGDLRRTQFRNPRRGDVTGAVGVHSAENFTDLVLPDSGAEAVAEWMVARPGPGSYHDIVDSDTAVHLVDYGHEAFHDGTGGNRWSLSLSFACKAHQWAELPETWVAGAIANGAAAARRQSDYVHARRGFHVPPRRITAAQYRSGIAGFVSHAQLDPTRRTDPGTDFPWDRFLAAYEATGPGSATTAESESMLRDFIELAYVAAEKPDDPKGVAYWWRTAAAEAPTRHWTWADCHASPTLQYMVGLLLGTIKP